MNNISTHTDLAKESLDNLIEGTHYSKEIIKEDDYLIETYQIKEDNKYLKKGKYIEIYFKQHTLSIYNPIKNILKKMIDEQNYPRILIIGLGNNNLTSDAIGPRVINEIKTTHYLDDSIKLENNYYDILAFIPGVMYQTGVETMDTIKALVDKFQIDLVIAIDALCTKDYQKLGHVIQINDVGIHPGSGIGNHRKALNKASLECKVIAIGIPTVIYASAIVSDILLLIKDYFGDALNKKNILKIGKKKEYIGTLNKKQSKQLLGELGMLNNLQLQYLLEEVLNPIDQNYIMSDKQIDEQVSMLSSLLAKIINDLRYK